MKKVVIALGIVGLLVIGGVYITWRQDSPERRLQQARSDVRDMLDHNVINSGDVIFQTSRSGQSKAIQLATGSEYSHCGIIFRERGEAYVLEAVQPVKRTPLEQWIARGQGGKYVIKRLVDSALITPSAVQRMKDIGNGFLGKSYDATFEWSDERIYCSELLWKLYQRSIGIEIGELERLGSFDLRHEAVRKKLQERYGQNIPLNEIVVSPAAIFNSPRLHTVASNK